MGLQLKEIIAPTIREHNYLQIDLQTYPEIDALLSLWSGTEISTVITLNPATIINWADHIIVNKILGIHITHELQQGQINFDTIGIVPTEPLETYRNEVIYRSKIRPNGLLYVQATPRFDKPSSGAHRINNSQFLILGKQIYQEYLHLLN